MTLCLEMVCKCHLLWLHIHSLFMYLICVVAFGSPSMFAPTSYDDEEQQPQPTATVTDTPQQDSEKTAQLLKEIESLKASLSDIFHCFLFIRNIRFCRFLTLSKSRKKRKFPKGEIIEKREIVARSSY